MTTKKIRVSKRETGGWNLIETIKDSAGNIVSEEVFAKRGTRAEARAQARAENEAIAFEAAREARLRKADAWRKAEGLPTRHDGAKVLAVFDGGKRIG